MSYDEIGNFIYPLPKRKRSKTSRLSITPAYRTTPIAIGPTVHPVHATKTVALSGPTEQGKGITGMKLNLTPSMAEELQNCPFLFQQKYLSGLKLPRFTRSAASQLGTNVHAALDTFYKRGAHARLEVDDLLNLLQARWDSAGFEDFDEELAYRQEGRRQLTNYYRATLDELSPQQRQTEKYHQVAALSLGRHKLSLSGRLDRLDLLADGSVEVLDYKTGSPTSGLPDETEMAESLANLIYYRLAQSLYPQAHAITVSRYYLSSKRKVSVRYTTGIVAVARAELERLLDGLEEGVAPPIENLGCAWCLLRKSGKCPRFSKTEPIEVAQQVF